MCLVHLCSVNVIPREHLCRTAGRTWVLLATASLGLSGKPLPSLGLCLPSVYKWVSLEPSVLASSGIPHVGCPCQLSQCFLADARLPDTGTGTRPEWKVPCREDAKSLLWTDSVYNPTFPLFSPGPGHFCLRETSGLRTVSYQLCVFSIGGCPPMNEDRSAWRRASPSVISCLDSCSKTPDSRGHCGAA